MMVHDWKKELFRKASISSLFKPHFQISSSPPMDTPLQEAPHDNPSAQFDSQPEVTFVDRLSDVSWEFYAWQLLDGREVFESRVGPQTASELTNMMQYQAYKGIQEPPIPSESPLHSPSHEDFVPYGVSGQHMSYGGETFEQEPYGASEMEEVGHFDEANTHGAEQPEPPETQSGHCFEEPTPVSPEIPTMEEMDPFADDILNLMGMNPFDPMNPMGMGGLPGF